MTVFGGKKPRRWETPAWLGCVSGAVGAFALVAFIADDLVAVAFGTVAVIAIGAVLFPGAITLRAVFSIIAVGAGYTPLNISIFSSA